jgi:heme/copper-type cytochrome/quinol oxidase subunit 2
MNNIKGASVVLAVLIALAIPHEVFACAACYGSANSSTVQGLNMAIIGMLGFMAAVFGGMVAFVIRMKRRAEAADSQVS